MKENNIILIGMMGAGKSTIGLELSKILNNYSLIDTDCAIEKELNMQISEIFKTFGEKYFREYETTLLKKICKNKNQIISTGGGIFEKEENQKLLKECGKIFYLKASAKTLFDRIKKQTHRPLLKQGFEITNIETILKKREINYCKADIVIDTENTEIYNIVKRIAKEI